ncbi:hypothetical protein H257_11803 [Aphanomyces astaci]|uniref:Uncharacterized protein n=1 Tax=Aphanomyces astaci TaxID=112090 RepID=W4G2U1_APHAT|nr:hypothetical protein H257_11803 [Aphanomyces astaci]ETV73263.1 hypothetical protein H257_11803 [Aphanomyces astaci]|eukprot:XP_009837138.1 hypothetical protein H257_11803 [Aphanomyces astaci]
MEHANDTVYHPPYEDDPLDQVTMDGVPVNVVLHDMVDVADASWHLVCADEETCIRWCMEISLLAESMSCPQCLGAMSFAMNTKRWWCHRRACEGGGHIELGMRFKSWFQGTRIPMTKLVRLLFAWASRMPLGVVIAEEEISIEAGVDWYNYCRELCSSEVLRWPMVVGGSGITVEIDETSMKKKTCGGLSRGESYEHPVAAPAIPLCIVGSSCGLITRLD